MLDAVIWTVSEVDNGSFRLEFAQAIGHRFGHASEGMLPVGDDGDLCLSLSCVTQVVGQLFQIKGET